MSAYLLAGVNPPHVIIVIAFLKLLGGGGEGRGVAGFAGFPVFSCNVSPVTKLLTLQNR